MFMLTRTGPSQLSQMVSEGCLCGTWQVVRHACTQEEVGATLVDELRLQQPVVDMTELEDARWFHRSWLSSRLHHTGACSWA